MIAAPAPAMIAAPVPAMITALAPVLPATQPLENENPTTCDPQRLISGVKRNKKGQQMKGVYKRR